MLRAFDEKLHRMVAIKVLSAELASTSPARKRFLREARSAAAIRHDNIVAIHAVEEEPIPYLVMEYIPGKTLQQFLDAHGPLDVTDTLRLSQQMASGLAAAHAQGLIHRDIKPSNILLEDGIQRKVKISDFGLARAADDASMTQSGTIAGTPLYMSPEQAHSNRIDQRSDLFSFGSVLYQMVSGRPPFRASSTLAVLKRVTEDTPRPIQEIIPEVPDWLCTIISKLHSKQPADRYQTASEVAELLARCQSELQHAGKVTCVQSSHHAPRDEPSAAAQPSPSRPRPNPTHLPIAVAQLIAAPKGSSRRSETATFNRPRLIAASIICTVAIIAILMFNRFNNSTDPASGGRQPNGTPSEISNLKSKISNAESEISNLKSHISNDPSTDPDRRAAEWVLTRKGRVYALTNGVAFDTENLESLPKGPVVISDIVIVGANNSEFVEVCELLPARQPLNPIGVHLYEVRVTDAALKQLVGTNVIRLFLRDSPFTDSCGQQLQQLSLRNLVITNCKLTDNGLASLTKLPELNQLALGSMPLSDAGVAQFADCPNLKHLGLTETRVTEAGVKKLSAAFPGCKIEWDGGMIEPTDAA